MLEAKLCGHLGEFMEWCFGVVGKCLVEGLNSWIDGRGPLTRLLDGIVKDPWARVGGRAVEVFDRMGHVEGAEGTM